MVKAEQWLREYIFQQMHERDSRFVADGLKEWDKLSGVLPCFHDWITKYVQAREIMEGVKN